MNKTFIFEVAKELSLCFGPSGREQSVRDTILSYIEGYAPYRIDALGNIIVEKKGKRTSSKTIMIDAHMDEVGMIITDIRDDGLLNFSTVGGILSEALVGKVVTFGGIQGVIGCLPIHCLNGEQKKQLPRVEDLYIDIGVSNKSEALQYVQPGDLCAFYSEFVTFGEGYIKGKALDDRIGCAILIDYIRSPQEFDTICTFSVQEEVGLVGAKTATYGVNPDIAFVVEATTAADIAGVAAENQVCHLKQGVTLSFMDRATVYDSNLFHTAIVLADKKEIVYQVKKAVAGGNNSGTVHCAREGVRTLALSVPCRYLHSACCVIHKDDVVSTARLLQEMVMYAGEIA